MKSSKIVKWSLVGVGALFLAYVGSIVWFEAQLGMNQPQGSTSLVIATFKDGGERHERVLRLEQIDGQKYIAANHWPRAWYKQALNNPSVEVKLPGDSDFEPYLAVPLEGAEEERIREIYDFGFEFRISNGLPASLFPETRSPRLSDSNPSTEVQGAEVCCIV